MGDYWSRDWPDGIPWTHQAGEMAPLGGGEASDPPEEGMWCSSNQRKEVQEFASTVERR